MGNYVLRHVGWREQSALEIALTTAPASGGFKEYGTGGQRILISPALKRGCASPLLISLYSCAKGIFEALFYHSGRACVSLALPLL